jgi:hypothetical protein
MEIKRIILIQFCLFLFLTSCDEEKVPSPNSRENVNGIPDDDTAENEADESSIADGASDADADADVDADLDDPPDTSANNNEENEVCASLDFAIESQPVRLMILQDVSGSMVQDQEPPTKWDQAKEALTTMFTTYEKAIDFGFDRFPNNNWCNVAPPAILDVAHNQTSEILSRLAGINPVGNTPLLKAINNFAQTEYAPVFTDGHFPSYLLVVSDGEDTCGLTQGIFRQGQASPEELATATKKLTDMGINTFVIGFGDGVNPDELNAIASNGGTGIDEYLVATDKQSLEDALTAVGVQVLSCVFNIAIENEPKVNLDDANFYFDGKVVGRDDGCATEKGWTWTDDTRSKVTFCKAACNKLKNRKVEKVEAKFGCPSVIIY